MIGSHTDKARGEADTPTGGTRSEPMSPTTEDRLRRFLLVLAGFVFAATVAELALVEHDESFVQLVPYILCGLGIAAVAAVIFRPRRVVLLASRWVLGLVALGSLYGWYEHVAHNLAFELEIRPNATTGEVLWDALGGASPLLAPGILALGAVLAYAATYRHPALTLRRTD